MTTFCTWGSVNIPVESSHTLINRRELERTGSSNSHPDALPSLWQRTGEWWQARQQMKRWLDTPSSFCIEKCRLKPDSIVHKGGELRLSLRKRLMSYLLWSLCNLLVLPFQNSWSIRFVLSQTSLSFRPIGHVSKSSVSSGFPGSAELALPSFPSPAKLLNCISIISNGKGIAWLIKTFLSLTKFISTSITPNLLH